MSLNGRNPLLPHCSSNSFVPLHEYYRQLKQHTRSSRAVAWINEERSYATGTTRVSVTLRQELRSSSVAVQCDVLSWIATGAAVAFVESACLRSNLPLAKLLITSYLTSFSYFVYLLLLRSLSTAQLLTFGNTRKIAIAEAFLVALVTSNMQTVIR